MQKYNTHQKKKQQWKKHTETQVSSKFRDGILLILNGIKPDTTSIQVGTWQISKTKERWISAVFSPRPKARLRSPWRTGWRDTETTQETSPTGLMPQFSTAIFVGFSREARRTRVDHEGFKFVFLHSSSKETRWHYHWITVCWWFFTNPYEEYKPKCMKFPQG